MGRSWSKLVVGLGNPGSRYRGTRHNVGFEVLDRLAAHGGVLFESPHSLFARFATPIPERDPAERDDPVDAHPESAFQDVDGEELASVAAYPFEGAREGAREDEGQAPPALLLKPQTFMNLSGVAVRPIVDRAQLAPEDVLVVYDDMDLSTGTLRIRPHGGAGGQKGMRSILDHLETDRIPRLRVGIGRPETDAARHVLSAFDTRERGRIDTALVEASEAIRFWLRGNTTEACMSRFHSRWNLGSHTTTGPAPDLEGER